MDQRSPKNIQISKESLWPLPLVQSFQPSCSCRLHGPPDSQVEAIFDEPEIVDLEGKQVWKQSHANFMAPV